MKTTRLLHLTALLGLASCVTSGGNPEEAWQRVQEDQIRIYVLHNNFADVTSWLVVPEAKRERLGVVTGKTEEAYVIPWDITQSLRLELDLLAGPRCLTRAIYVDPGDILHLEILSVFRETDWCENA